MQKTASLLKIVSTDFIAFVGLIAPVVCWGLSLFFFATEGMDPGLGNFFIFSGAATVVGLGLVVWRMITIVSVFNDGLEVQAVVSGVFFFRDRGRIDTIYTFQGQKIQSGNAVLKGRVTRSFQIGQPVVVMVDRSNPKRSFIRDLYC